MELFRWLTFRQETDAQCCQEGVDFMPTILIQIVFNCIRCLWKYAAPPNKECRNQEGMSIMGSIFPMTEVVLRTVFSYKIDLGKHVRNLRLRCNKTREKKVYDAPEPKNGKP